MDRTPELINRNKTVIRNINQRHTMIPSSLLPIISSGVDRFREIPHTLDLRSNARLSINFLKGTMDRHQVGVPYFTIYFGADPVALSHKVYDLDENPGRWLYGFVSAREVVGSVNGIDCEKVLKDYLFSRVVHNDGMVYLPKYSPMCSVSEGDSAWMWGNRSAFMGLLSLYMVRDDAEIKEHLDKAVNALYGLVIQGDGGLYLNQDYYAYNSKVDASKPPLLGQNMGGWITPLVKYYQWTGNEKAMELANGFADFIVKHHAAVVRNDEPSSLGVVAGDMTGNRIRSPRLENDVLKIANVHGALFTIGGVLRVAEMNHNIEQVAWAMKLVDYTIEHLATSFGWVPEHEHDRMLGRSDTQSSEGCAVADLVNCCIYLARNGHSEYWNQVERYTRNYLEEGQLKNTDWLPHSVKREDTVKESYDEIPARVRGAYVGWGDPNDFVNPAARAPRAVQNCCGPHCAWATSLVWHNIVRKNDRGVYINLMLNKRTPWCEVLSYHPYKGQVDVEMYVDSTVHILVPDWVNKSQVTLRINGNEDRPIWDDSYLILRDRLQGDKIVVDYPMRIVTITDTIKGKGVYHTRWKGNTVVSIDPQGKIVPLFQRDSMLSESCPMKQERVLERGARVEIPLDEIDW